MGIGLYDASYDPTVEESALYDWEERWFSRVLPEPPGTLLVAACGGGREIGALLARGYEVTGFEPAERPRDHALALYGGDAEILDADFAALTAAVDGDTRSPLAEVAERRFDAVILGWGSFTHVASPDQRAAIVKAANALTGGPILASFYFGEGLRTAHSKTGRAADWGRRIGRVIGRARGAEGIAGDWDFFGWGGFAHRLTVDDVESAARAAGREAIWTLTDGFPHATFVRPSS